ncbi:hypothetical protein D3C75_1371600 [compost metagenome]
MPSPPVAMAQAISPTRRNQTPLTARKARMAQCRWASKFRSTAVRQARAAKARISTPSTETATAEMSDR